MENKALKIFKLLSVIFVISIFSAVGSILIYQTKAQWTGAPGLPPSSNVPAPLNIGSSNQQKVGGLTLGKDIYIDPRVSNSTQSGLRLFPNSATGMYGYLFNNFNTLQYNVQTSTGEERRFTIGNDGNTAIGDIIPQAKLHVDGSIRANGVIQAIGKVYSEGNEVLTSFSEQDPKVGVLTNNQWCYTDGSQVICNQNAPQTRVASSCSAGSAINIIYSDGTVSCETDDIGTFTLAAGSVASSHILNDTILTQDLSVSDIETTFQRRTSGNCDGQAVVSINQNGTLNCETDDIGLTSIPANSVGSSEIINSSITSNDIDTSSVQRRVSGTCAAGESIREIKSDGTVTCEADDVGVGGGVSVSCDWIGWTDNRPWTGGDNCLNNILTYSAIRPESKDLWWETGSCTTSHAKGYTCTLTIGSRGSYHLSCSSGEDHGEWRGSLISRNNISNCSGSSSVCADVDYNANTGQWGLTSTGKENNHNSPYWTTKSCAVGGYK